MKKFLSKHKLLLGLLLLIAAISLNACKRDDDKVSIDAKILETLDGTKWKLEESGAIIYLKFKNSTTIPMEIWFSFIDESCFMYGNSTSDGNDVTIEILENTSNKLVIKTIDSPEDYSIATITKSGDQLNLKDEYYYNGALDETVVMQFTKTSINLDNLEICDLDFSKTNKMLKKIATEYLILTD